MWMTILRRRFILKIENGAWDLSLMTRLLLDGSKFCVMLASLGVTFGLIPVLLNAFTRRLESIGVFSNLIFTNNQLIMPIGEVFVSKKCSTRCPLSFRWKAVLAPNPPGSVRSVRFAPCVPQPFHNVLRSRAFLQRIAAAKNNPIVASIRSLDTDKESKARTQNRCDSPASRARSERDPSTHRHAFQSKQTPHRPSPKPQTRPLAHPLCAAPTRSKAKIGCIAAPL